MRFMDTNVSNTETPIGGSVLRQVISALTHTVKMGEPVKVAQLYDLMKQAEQLADYTVSLEQTVFDLNVILSTTIEHSATIEDSLMSQRDADMQKHRQYEAILNVAQEGVLVIDRSYRGVACNPSFASLFGVSVEEMGAWSLDQIWGSGVFVSDIQPELERVWMGHSSVGPLSAMMMGQRRQFLECWFYPFVMANGEITHLIGVFRDVTEHRRVLAQLHQHTLYLDKVRDAIVVIGLDRMIYYFNRSAEELYGWNRNQMNQYHPIESLVQSMDKLTMILEAVSEHGSWRGEMLHVNQNRKNVWVDSQWSHIESADGTPFVLIATHDISEKKVLEQQFLQIQRMEGIGAVASGIAHDLNNVLSALFMSVRLLKGNCKDEKSLQILDLLDNSAKRGVNLVRQILEFTRGIDRDEVSVHLKGMLREIQSFAKTTFPKTIVVDLMPIPGDLWVILGNPTQIHQVILNICVNAKDAMLMGGKLVMAVGNVMVVSEAHITLPEYCQPGPYVRIEISDTGKGMSPATIDRIFDPFFTTKATGKGTGLGLSTVHTIIKNHRGFIEVHSELNKGSTFSIYFPAQRPQMDGAPLKLGANQS